MANSVKNIASTRPTAAPRLWSEQSLATGATIDLSQRAMRHVAALRLHDGDAVTLFDGEGGEWSAELLRVGRDRASAKLKTWSEIERESPLMVTLALGISSGERMDFAIQKATELGVNVVQPIATMRSVVRLKEERAERRLAHWRGVAIASCEQCGRNRLPIIKPVSGLLEFVASQPPGLRILLSPEGDNSLKAISRSQAIAILIGAEGGLTAQERNDALRNGFIPMRFGPRVLRTETAPLAVLAAIQAAWGDCSG
ncbi:MAG: 16S rRNA (uracil(1498)-N(3))-methyltransferase [Betaproteobacteria bacterium]|nr:16S rRNA (uracil(1498)-N(3))-methyltransferase [Betaproteobacteria bacterium]